ncbi:MAG: Eco57I restriction-modification methylase domain-containing protein [Deltaproteobacteria bacterium]|nr:Eco57I restriction-modification methylase domain-containing protein [Deltaproteobacteria bacterium]
MHLDFDRVRKLLKDFDFHSLFIEELGWDHHDARLEIILGERTIKLEALAEKRGMVAYLCPAAPDETLPDHAARRKIEHQVSKRAHEHLIIFTDANHTTQVWQWVKREPGKPLACREHTFHQTQPGDALIQKLQAIAFSLKEEETLTLFDVTRRARAGFDVEKVTKRFYDRFQKEHSAFLKFVTGITDDTDHQWYASVMLNRLMFVYFIQRKGFLDGDSEYLRNRLARMQSEYGRDRFYSFYRYFLLRLFHEGLGAKERSPEIEDLLGNIPYFDGGFFERHPVEENYPGIQIPDEAFERIFDYFDQYQWHLDERPLRGDNEINPDVLGYIFEKYINQKQMGAYYTKEDITEYISKNTVIPFLFDAAKSKCKVAFENPGGSAVWDLLSLDPDRYVYQAVKHGVIKNDGTLLPESELPDFVQTGMHDPKARMFDQRYNLQQAPAEDPIRLVTETWREYIYRRNRCLEVREKLKSGEVDDINELITFNLDIRQFAQDVIEKSEGPELLRAFWHTINGYIPAKSHEKYQNGITILDPTCGSGAFLFAALNILEPLYEACLERMASFVEDLDRSDKKHRPEKSSDFRRILKQVADHPNRRYYIFKNIILYNLFGVDIMEEAVEICKLRLFLKLVAQVEPNPDKENYGIEPLPDIDFNIRAGNTLVGYATEDEVRKLFTEESDGQAKLQFGDVLSEFQRFEERLVNTDRAFKHFRGMQIDPDTDAKDFSDAKQTLRDGLKCLDDELNLHLAKDYRIAVGKKSEYEKWLKSHQPFHWFVEFYGIMKNGGFDVIIGNPPYVELKSIAEYCIRGYICEKAANLYAVMLERSFRLRRGVGRMGFIVPISSVSTDRYKTLQGLISSQNLYYSSFDDRPSRLFDGLEHIRLSIHLIDGRKNENVQKSTRYNKWNSEERGHLFNLLKYASYSGDSNLVPGSLPKFSSIIEDSIKRKLQREKTSLSRFYLKAGNHSIFYSRKVGYFLQVLDFVPEVYDGQGKQRNPSEFKKLIFSDPGVAKCALGCLNANLFYWFVTVFSDCRHVNKREINLFPADLQQLHKSPYGQHISDLSKELMRSLAVNSERHKMSFRHDSLTVQCIYPKLSKSIIDQIDQVLGKHYGFTDEELDFIINYDIKYRMGRVEIEG